MRFTVPFLLAIAVYVATVLGANQTSFTPNEDMLYDVVSASDAIAYRLERALGLTEKPALLLGALLLTLPALLTFHLFRIGFGGSVQSLLQEERLSQKLAQEREHAAAARYTTANSSSATVRARDGDVLARSRAGESAREVRAGNDRDERRSRENRHDDNKRRRGLKANLAAALSGRKSGTEKSTSGTTSLSSTSDDGAKGAGLKDRWAGVLETKPDLSRLKSGAQNLKNKIGSRPASTKLSLDDIADDVADKSS